MHAPFYKSNCRIFTFSQLVWQLYINIIACPYKCCWAADIDSTRHLQLTIILSRVRYCSPCSRRESLSSSPVEWHGALVIQQCEGCLSCRLQMEPQESGGGEVRFSQAQMPCQGCRPTAEAVLCQPRRLCEARPAHCSIGGSPTCFQVLERPCLAACTCLGMANSTHPNRMVSADLHLCYINARGLRMYSVARQLDTLPANSLL